MSTVSASGLVAVYSVLLDANKDAVDDCCAEMRIGLDDLEWALSQYRKRPDYTWEDEHLQMARWFVVKVGRRTGGTPTQFEAAVASQLESNGAADRLVFPCWLLAAPVEGAIDGRLPARPLGGFEKVLERAHDGLLGHVDQRAKLAELPHKELALSSTIWRMSGIIEDIAQGRSTGPKLHHHIAWLQSHLRSLPDLSSAEQALCRILDPDLSNLRNALTHVSRGLPWTFDEAATHVEARENDIWEMAAAVNLGVMYHLVENERQIPAPHWLFPIVRSELEWIF